MKLTAIIIICGLIPPAQSGPCERANAEKNICGPVTHVGDVVRMPGFIDSISEQP